MEQIAIIILFLGALAYIANKIRCEFLVKNSGCAKNCGGGCKVPDFEDIQVSDTKSVYP